MKTTTKKKHPKKKSTQSATPAPDAATVLREFNSWRREHHGVAFRPTEIDSALDDAIKALDPWQMKETAPVERTRVLAAYVGVYGPVTGVLIYGRFYPDGSSGSEPFTHWMPIPAIKAAAQ